MRNRLLTLLYGLVPSPTVFFSLSFLATLVSLYIVNLKLDSKEFNWHDIIVESHGVLFDLLVFGFLISIYDYIRVNRERGERLQEEIDDYRGWNEKEATFRIVGAIKRLNKIGLSAVNLAKCFLQNADMQDLNLEKADLSYANFIDANLKYVNLRSANLLNANLQGAKLKEADVQQALLIDTNLKDTNLANSNLREALLTRAKFIGANLENVNLTRAAINWVNFNGANLKGANLKNVSIHNDFLSQGDIRESHFLANLLVDNDFFQKLETWKVIGREAIIEKYYIDENNRLQLRNPPTP